MIDAAGGSAHLWGSSSGAVLAMIATAAGAPVDKLALWEPPFILDENARPPADQVEQYERMIAEGRRGDAAEYFMSKVVRMPPEFVADARNAAVVGRAGGDRPHARVRRPHHGRLLHPDRDGGIGQGPDPRARRRGRLRVHAGYRGDACRRHPRRARSGSSRDRGTTSIRRSWLRR